jgi:enoyl-[acyl-carrier protein] reductase/trans-2-enoyl-CoA reductase (NAD+)
MMVIAPKVRGFICTTSHPAGCAANVDEAIEVIQSHAAMRKGPKRVLIIGSSTGFGISLSSDVWRRC